MPPMFGVLHQHLLRIFNLLLLVRDTTTARGIPTMAKKINKHPVFSLVNLLDNYK